MTESTEPKRCYHCGSPIVLRRATNGKWYPFNPSGERHQCAEYFQQRRRTTVAVLDDLEFANIDVALPARPSPDLKRAAIGTSPHSTPLPAQAVNPNPQPGKKSRPQRRHRPSAAPSQTLVEDKSASIAAPGSVLVRWPEPIADLQHNSSFQSIRTYDLRFAWFVRRYRTHHPRRAKLLYRLINRIASSQALPASLSDQVLDDLEHLYDYYQYWSSVELLEDELYSLLASFLDPADVDIVFTELGWDGRSPVPNHLRHAATHAATKRLAERRYWLPCLDRAIKLIASRGKSHGDFSSELRQLGLTQADSYSIEAVVEAATLFRRSFAR